MKKALALSIIFFLGVFSWQAVGASGFLSMGFEKISTTNAAPLEEGQTPLEEEREDGLSSQIPEEEEKELSESFGLSRPYSSPFKIMPLKDGRKYQFFLKVPCPPPKLS